MAANWHTMAVISCPSSSAHFTEFLLGINTSVLGGKAHILPTHLHLRWSCWLGCPPQPLWFALQREGKPCKTWVGGKQWLFVLLVQLNTMKAWDRPSYLGLLSVVCMAEVSPGEMELCPMFPPPLSIHLPHWHVPNAQANILPDVILEV